MESEIPNFIAESLVLLIEEKDYENITISDIVQKAGVSRASFYRYFQTKEEVFLHFLELEKKQIIKISKSNDKNQKNPRKTLSLILKSVQNYKALFQSITKTGLKKLYEEYIDKEIIFLLCKNYDINKNKAVILSGALKNTIFEWLRSNCKEDVDSLIDDFLESFL